MSGERAVIYRRQSSDPRNDELGISRQLEVCQRVATARGYSVEQVITDNDVSASKHGRPGYGELIRLMQCGGIDVVLILRIDRLLRLNDELEELIAVVEHYPVRVVTAEGEIDLSTAQGRLLARILVSVARNEIEVKSARHKLANRQKAAQGLPYASWRAFGYEPDGLTIREPEAAVLREMARRVIVGHSYHEIATWLNSIGQRTARGNKWYAAGVRQILRFKRYAGIREYDGVDYPAQWLAIFDAESWERLQLAIRQRTMNYPTGTPVARKYLLTGLLYCGICGGAMNGSTKRDRPDKALRRTYYCRKPADRAKLGCGGVQRGAPALEHFVTECLFLRLDTPQFSSALADTADDAELRQLLDMRDTVQLRLNGILDDYGTGVLSKPQMMRAKSAAEAELERLNNALLRSARATAPVGLPNGKTIRQAWAESSSDSWRRSILSLVIKQINVFPTDAKPWYEANGQRYRFDPDAIEIKWLA